MQLVTGFVVLGALWIAVHAALWGLANTLDTLALELHQLATRLRALHARRSAELSEAWVQTLERSGAVPAPQDEAFLRRSGIAPDRLDGYTGE